LTGSAVAVSSDTSQVNALGRFRFLAKLQTRSDVTLGSAAEDHAGTLLGQLNRYVSDIATMNIPETSGALEFWASRRSTYSHLVPIAEDILSAPASQAFVERIFSLCGVLTAGRRNRMLRSLQMRVLLKLNSSLVD